MDLRIDALHAWHTTRAGRTRVLDDVTLTLARGSLHAVLGPSGSGKTTLLRAIAGLHRDMTGTIHLGETPLHALPPQRRQVGLVPQEGALFPQLTVTENIEFGLARSARGATRTAEMLELLDLGPYARRLPHQLSGGQAQRVAVARALAPAPRLVLLDEPFSALDASLRAEVRDGVRTALEQTRTTGLLVTHDRGEALSLATRLIVLADGRIRQVGRPPELYADPVDVWTARFLGDANTIDGTTDGTTVTTALGRHRHPSVAPGPVTVLIRPEQMVLRTQEHRGDGVDGVDGVVRFVRYFGHDGVAMVDTAAAEPLLARFAAAHMPATGERVRLTVSGEVRAYPSFPDRPAARGTHAAAEVTSSEPSGPTEARHCDPEAEHS